jgi:hypothetical protein
MTIVCGRAALFLVIQLIRLKLPSYFSGGVCGGVFWLAGVTLQKKCFQIFTSSLSFAINCTSLKAIVGGAHYRGTIAAFSRGFKCRLRGPNFP